jgi:ABC-type nitrate/sulfonate/bicarbonate transport system permease component
MKHLRSEAIAGWYRAHERRVWSTTSFVGVFLLWELASALGLVSRQFLSSPSAIIGAGAAELQQPRFWLDLRTSVFEFVSGYGVAVVLGVPIGLALGWYRRLSYYFEPLLNFLYATPRVALLPLIVLWFGIGIWSKVAVVFLGAFVTILLNTFFGVRTVDARFTTVARTFGAGQVKTFRSVVFPSSLPFILAGMRLGIGRALIGVVVGELYGASEGLGFMIKIASNNFQIDRMLFAVIVLIGFGLLTVAIIRRLERRLAPWRVEPMAE